MTERVYEAALRENLHVLHPALGGLRNNGQHLWNKTRKQSDGKVPLMAYENGVKLGELMRVPPSKNKAFEKVLLLASYHTLFCSDRTYYVDAQSRVAEPLVPPCLKGIAARYFFVACVARPEDRGRRDTPKHKNMCYPKLSPAEYVLGLRYTAKGAAMEVPCPWGSLEAV
eukprot:GHVT01035126.1.p1 GENE.GHVT01035126.1~~GHVT01035126.1.p1  ORF type:complete len:170 (+),score=24.50 GHVT01035126.1:1030-1539(+)